VFVVVFWNLSIRKTNKNYFDIFGTPHRLIVLAANPPQSCLQISAAAEKHLSTLAEVAVQAR
jgi:hypothetical protein